MSQRILVTGDRNWQAMHVILQSLRSADKDAVVIHGAAPGADTIAGQAALILGLQVDLPPTPTTPYGGYPADWQKHGKGAGPIRNRWMFKESSPTEVWAFHDKLWTASRGTRDMVANIALPAGVPVTLYLSNGRTELVSALQPGLLENA